MILSKRNYLAFLLLAIGVVCVLLITHGTAKASSTSEPSPVVYHEPTGPELSPTGAAEAAIKAARGGATSPGNMTIRVAHGTYVRLSAALNGNEVGSGPTTSGKASCFPGMSCTSAAVEEHERLQRESDESSAYIVEMKGTAFSPPRGRLRKGEKATASSGEVETVIVNAHTGFPEERTIGGGRPDLAGLGSVTELVATVRLHRLTVSIG